MTSATQSSNPSGPPETIQRLHVHILSPSSGIPSHMNFHLPTTTTIADLKLMIHDTAPTKPQPDHQRLIYRGRPLTRDEQSLAEVLGNPNLASQEAFSIHLVVRPTESEDGRSRNTSSEAVSSSTLLGSQTPQPAPGQLPQNGVIGGAPRVPSIVHPPSETRAEVRDQLQVLEQQVAAIQNEILMRNQGPHPHNHNRTHVQMQGPPTSAGPQVPFPFPPSFQQIIAQQQQARAAAGLQGLTGADVNQNGSGSGESQAQGASTAPQNGEGDNSRQRGPGSSREFSSEGVGPGGQRWQIRVNETTMVVPTATQVGPEERPIQRAPFHHPQPLDLYRRHNNAAPVRSTPSPTIHASASTDNNSQSATYDPSLSTVYLLSSPNGPVGLVLHPQATYTHTPIIPLLPQFPHFSPPPAQFPAPPPIGPRIPGRMQAPGANYFGPRQRPFNPPAAHPPPAPEAPPRPANNGNNNQAMRDLARHLWLFIRLFGFVFFFTSGAGWRRTIILCVAAAVVFAVQTGWFGDLQESLLGPIRRHLDGLLPLAEVNATPANAAQQQGDINRASTTPEEAAQRLVRERQSRNSSWLRELSRRIERAILIFAASLVPGVGERHIAARDAAEALRATAERERIERENREREEREGANEVFTDARDGQEVPGEGGGGESSNTLASGVHEQEHNTAIGAH